MRGDVTLGTGCEIFGTCAIWQVQISSETGTPFWTPLKHGRNACMRTTSTRDRTRALDQDLIGMIIIIGTYEHNYFDFFLVCELIRETFLP